MVKRILFAFALVVLIHPHFGFADEPDDAIKAAGTILSLLNQKKYGEAWDRHVSRYFKSKTTRDLFIANMTFGRAALGPLASSVHVGTEFANQDPAFNYQGRLYAITFLNTYGVGKVYERVVIVLDDDGQLRLGGIMAAPAPN